MWPTNIYYFLCFNFCIFLDDQDIFWILQINLYLSLPVHNFIKIHIHLIWVGCSIEMEWLDNTYVKRLKFNAIRLKNKIMLFRAWLALGDCNYMLITKIK